LTGRDDPAPGLEDTPLTTKTIEPTEDRAPHPADVETTEPEGFHITTDEAANWLLGKLANIEAEKARVRAQAEKITKQLDADAEGLRFLYAAELETYVKAKLAATGGRRKSVHFLQASCAFRTVPARLTVSDQAAALEWARETLPAAVATRETLDSAAYLKTAQAKAEETGELLPGVEIAPARESFSVSFG
jgi:phage host-nuclease inhibitor protein Gam